MASENVRGEYTAKNENGTRTAQCPKDRFRFRFIYYSQRPAYVQKAKKKSLREFGSILETIFVVETSGIKYVLPISIYCSPQ